MGVGFALWWCHGRVVCGRQVCVIAGAQIHKNPANQCLQGIKNDMGAVVGWRSCRFGHLAVWWMEGGWGQLSENTRTKKKHANVSWQGLYSSSKCTM